MSRDVLDPVRAEGTAGDLEQVRDQVVELLQRLPRPPTQLRVRAGGVSVDISWAEAPAATVTAVAVAGAGVPEPAPEGDLLRSPAVGVFYHAREPGAEPFAPVGSTVRPGQQIGVIEAMKLMIPVEADRGGIVAAVLKADGEPVEYDEPLLALAPPED